MFKKFINEIRNVDLNKEVEITDPLLFDIGAFILLFAFVTFPFVENLYYLFFNTSISSLREIWNNVVCGVGLFLLSSRIYLDCPRNKNVIEKYLKDNPIVILFSIFVLLMIVSCVINGINEMTIYGDYYRRESIYVYIGYVVYFFLVVNIRNIKIKKSILYSLIITSAPTSLIYVIYMLSQKTVFKFANNMAAFSNSNHAGYYLVVVSVVTMIASIVCENKFVKTYSFVAYLINVEGLLVNNTLGAQFGFILSIPFSIIVLALTRKKYALLPLIYFGLALLLLYPINVFDNELYKSIVSSYTTFYSDVDVITNTPELMTGAEGTKRIKLWGCTINHISKRPLTGYGIDGTKDMLMKEVGPMDDRPHNEYLYYAVSFGIPTAIAYLSCIFTIYFRGLFHKKELMDYNLIGLIGGFGYCVSAFFGNTMWYTAPFLFILLGYGYFKGNKKIDE